MLCIVQIKFSKSNKYRCQEFSMLSIGVTAIHFILVWLALGFLSVTSQFVAMNVY